MFSEQYSVSLHRERSVCAALKTSTLSYVPGADVLQALFAWIWFKQTCWLKSLGGISEEDPYKGLPRRHSTICMSCSVQNDLAAGWQTWLEHKHALVFPRSSEYWKHSNKQHRRNNKEVASSSIKYIFNWILSGTESLKGAENSRMRGKWFYPKRGCSTGSQGLRKQQVFLLRCSSNVTPRKHFNIFFSCHIDILICDVINGCCRNTNSWLNWKNRQDFQFPASLP